MSWRLLYCLYVTYNQQNVFYIACWNRSVKWPEKVACFDLEIEHVTIHRNEEKNSVLNNRNNHHLRRVGSFCLIWW